MKMYTRITSVALALAFALGMVACRGFGLKDTRAVTLVENGQAIAEIVVPEKPLSGITLAAEDLQKHLELMSGAKLPIVSKPTPGVKTQVYVGTSELTVKLGFTPATFNNSGFEIVAKDHYVILAGPDRQRNASPYSEAGEETRYLNGSAILGLANPKPEKFPSPGLKAWQDFCGEKFRPYGLTCGLGEPCQALKIRVNDDVCTWYAVSELLEQLGVRWYMPYDNGTVVPEAKTIAVARQYTRKEAKFGMREWCFYNAMRLDPAGVTWLKRLKSGNFNPISYQHNTYGIYSSYEQQVAHPEYLACDATGKPYAGYPTGRGMPRYSDPGFRKAAVMYMNRMFDACPELAAVAIGPPDGGVKMDTRDVNLYGKPTDTLDQKTSNYLWDFNVHLARELKKSHPDKGLLYMTGYGAAEIPSNISEFPDNIVIPFIHASYTRVLLDVDRAILASHHQWLDTSRKSGVTPKFKSPVWDYFLYYRNLAWPRYPVVFTASLQAQMKEMLPYAEGKFIELQNNDDDGVVPAKDGKKQPRIGVPGLMHLMVYWQSKLFWDPDLDRKKTLDEYYTLFFGPAEVEMREFYEFAEEVWSRQESRSISAGNLGFLKEKDVGRYFDILKRAHGMAGKGTVYDQWISLMETEMASLKKLFANLKRTGPSFRAYPASELITLDGDMNKALWQPANILWYAMSESQTGKMPRENKSKVAFRLTPDKSALVVAVVCEEANMAGIFANTWKNDDVAIFKDDVVELIIETPERSYFKIAVNPNGAIWDESQDVTIVSRDTLPLLWNPGIAAVVKKEKTRWTAEIRIPTKDFGSLGPTMNYPWGINVCRTRLAGGPAEVYTLSPAGNTQSPDMSKLGNLWAR